MTSLETNPPEVFMEAKEFPRVSGVNTSDSFPQRDAFVAERYRVLEENGAFVVCLRNDLAVL